MTPACSLIDGPPFHDPDGASTTRRPSGWVGTIANPGRVVSVREKAVTSVRYCPFAERVARGERPLAGAIGRGYAGQRECSSASPRG